jgi:hypothetical protein
MPQHLFARFQSQLFHALTLDHRLWCWYAEVIVLMLVNVSGCSSPSTLFLTSSTCTSASASVHRLCCRYVLASFACLIMYRDAPPPAPSFLPPALAHLASQLRSTAPVAGMSWQGVPWMSTYHDAHVPTYLDFWLPRVETETPPQHIFHLHRGNDYIVLTDDNSHCCASP